MQGERGVVVLDLVFADLAEVDRLDDPLVRLDQVTQVHVVEFECAVVLVLLVGGRVGRTGTRAVAHRVLESMLVEPFGGDAVALVGQELLDQFVARVRGLETFPDILGAFLAVDGLRWLEGATLDLDEGRGDDQELAGKLDVDLVDLLEVLEVLTGDLHDRDVVDVDLRPSDQEEQEVEGTLEVGQTDLVVILKRFHRYQSVPRPGPDAGCPHSVSHRPTRGGYTLDVKKPADIHDDRTPGTGEGEFIAEVLRAEADAVARLAALVPDRIKDWGAALDLLEPCSGHVVIAGMGKSGLVGAKISATLSSLGQPSNFVHPAEAVHGDLGRIRRGDVVLLLSFSGETEELISLAHILKADGVPLIGISSAPESTLARSVSVHLDLGGITEACPLNLAPTASTTAMMAVGDGLALALARRRDFGADDFHKHHPGGMLGAGLRPVTEVLRFRVGDNLPILSDRVSVREALREAGGDRRAGAILLVDESGRLSGIFTDGDLRRLVNRAEDPTAALNSDIAGCMTRSPRHLTTNDLVRDAVRLVRELRVDEIPVVDPKGTPVGMIDVQDLIAMKVVQELDGESS